MEEFIDAVSDGAVWGIGFGLAAMAVRSAGGVARPFTRGIIRGAVSVGDWVKNTTAESRETLQDLYHEAKAEREAEATHRAGA